MFLGLTCQNVLQYWVLGLRILNLFHNSQLPGVSILCAWVAWVSGSMGMWTRCRSRDVGQERERPGADPGFWSGGPRRVLTPRGPWAHNLLKIRVFPLKLPENCMILKKSLGQRGPGPPGPPGSATGGSAWVGRLTSGRLCFEVRFFNSSHFGFMVNGEWVWFEKFIEVWTLFLSKCSFTWTRESP